MTFIRNLLDWVMQYLWIIVLVVVVGIMVGLATYTIGGANSKISDTKAKSNAMNAMEFTKYNGTVVDGSDVAAAISTFSGSPTVGVQIVGIGTTPATPKYGENKLRADVHYTAATPAVSGSAATGGSHSTTNEVSFLQATNVSGANYINPAWSFDATVHVDSAGNVVLIRFQKR